jgi:hypothetical protein
VFEQANGATTAAHAQQLVVQFVAIIHNMSSICRHYGLK